MRLFPVRLTLILLCFSAAFRADAATYTVKAGGGGNYTTIQACANVAVAGDTCTVYAGNYAERPTLPTSGTAGNPITFKVNTGDAVQVQGFVITSNNYITVGGTAAASGLTAGANSFEVTSVSAGNIILDSVDHVIIQNNYIHGGGARCIDHNVAPANKSTYVSLLGNILDRCGILPATPEQDCLINGDHWRVDDNTWSHSQDGCAGPFGTLNVIRRNHSGPVDQVADFNCPLHAACENGSYELHYDSIEYTCSGANPAIRNLVEGNVMQDLRGGQMHGMGLLRDTGLCGTTNNIVRFNAVMSVGSYGLWGPADNVFNTRIYNNSVSWSELDLVAKERSSFTITNNSTGTKAINNLIADEWLSNSVNWCISYDPSSATGFLENHNLCFMTGYAGVWNGPSSVDGSSAYDASDIFNQDPKFVNPASDVHLLAGSPAIGAGGPLTTANGSGTSSTTLIVNDAGFFQDGFGIAGVQADWVRVGTSALAKISSINYATNTLTLAAPISWANTNPVYLYSDSNGKRVLFGIAPDIGAYQFGPTTSFLLKTITH